MDKLFSKLGLSFRSAVSTSDMKAPAPPRSSPDERANYVVGELRNITSAAKVALLRLTPHLPAAGGLASGNESASERVFGEASRKLAEVAEHHNDELEAVCSAARSIVRASMPSYLD